jgi:hypothetical protein
MKAEELFEEKDSVKELKCLELAILWEVSSPGRKLNVLLR